MVGPDCKGNRAHHGRRFVELASSPWHSGLGNTDAARPHPNFSGYLKSDVSTLEMHRTFNMGMGMVVAVSEEYAASAERWISKRLAGSRIVGRVVSNGRRVTHPDPEVVFSHY